MSVNPLQKYRDMDAAEQTVNPLKKYRDMDAATNPAAKLMSDGQEPGYDLIGGIKDLGKMVYDIPIQTKGAVGQLLEGDDPYAKTNFADTWQQEATARTAQRAAETTPQERASKIIPLPEFLSENGALTRGDVQDTSQSTGFSLAAMGAGLAGAGAGTVAGLGPWGTAGGAMAGAGTAAYKMDKTAITRQLIDSTEKTVGKLTDAQRQELLDKTEEIRNNHALWEAGPEAVGTALSLSGIGKIFSGAAKGATSKIIAGIVSSLGGELSTETITQIGQNIAEHEMGLGDGEKMDWNMESAGKALQEVAPSVLTLTGAMGGGGYVAGKAVKAFGKSEEAGRDTAANLARNQAALAIKQANLPTDDLMAARQDPQRLAEMGVTADDIDIVIADRNDDLNRAKDILLASGESGPMTRTAALGINAEQAKIVMGRERDRGEGVVPIFPSIPPLIDTPPAGPLQAAADMLMGGTALPGQIDPVAGNMASFEENRRSTPEETVDTLANAPVTDIEKGLMRAEDASAFTGTTYTDPQVQEATLARRGQAEDAFMRLPPNDGNAPSPVDHLLPAFDKMLNEVRQGEVSKSYQNREGETTPRASTHPDWYKQDTVTAYNKKYGTSLKLDKSIIAATVRKVRDGKPLTDRQAAVFAYMEEVAGKKAQTDPDLMAGPVFDKLNREGFDIQAPQDIQAGSLKPGDEVVIEKNGVPDKLVHKGFDGKGNAILQDGVTMHVDPFEQIQIIGQKTGESKISPDEENFLVGMVGKIREIGNEQDVDRISGEIEPYFQQNPHLSPYREMVVGAVEERRNELAKVRANEPINTGGNLPEPATVADFTPATEGQIAGQMSRQDSPSPMPSTPPPGGDVGGGAVASPNLRPENTRDEKVVAGKEPWQIPTGKEYARSVFKAHGLKGKISAEELARFGKEHVRLIKNAIADGKDVPMDVLENYRLNDFARDEINRGKAREQEQSEISSRVGKQQQNEKDFAQNSLYVSLMGGNADKVASLAKDISKEDARYIVDRLDAAPGDSPQVRNAIYAKYPDLNNTSPASVSDTRTGEVTEELAGTTDTGGETNRRGSADGSVEAGSSVATTPDAINAGLSEQTVGHSASVKVPAADTGAGGNLNAGVKDSAKRSATIPRPATEDDAKIIARYGLSVDDIAIEDGSSPLTKGKVRVNDGNWHDNIKDAVDAYARSKESKATFAKEAESRKQAGIYLAEKLKRGEKPTIDEWKGLFPHLKSHHTYVTQPEISPFLVEYFGFSKARVRGPLGKAAGDLVSDMGGKKPIVYLNRLHEVLAASSDKSATPIKQPSNKIDEQSPDVKVGAVPPVEGQSSKGETPNELRPQSDATTDTRRGAAADTRAELSAHLGADGLQNLLAAGTVRILTTQDQARKIIDRLKTRARAKLSAAFHGSPHDFERFSTGKIGTGEGAQAYGHGLYFSGSKEVAEWYRDKLGGRLIAYLNGERVEDQNGFLAANIRNILGYKDFEKGKKETLDDMRFRLERERENPAFKGSWLRDAEEKALVDAISAIEGASKGDIAARKGRLYQVELAPSEDEYLLWDRPLSEQSETVRKSLRQFFVDEKSRLNTDAGGLAKRYPSGEAVYRQLVVSQNGKQAASEYLHSLGIRGVKYLDGSSRGKGEGNFNYVIFDENDVEITVRYSKAGKIQGFATANKVYLVQDGIAKGKAFAVLKHELSVHLRELTLNSADFKALLSSIESRQNEQSRTGDAIRAAMGRVPADTKPEHIAEETLAYLVEMSPEIGIGRRFIALIKRMLVKMGISPKIFSAADLAALAEAAVRGEARSGGKALSGELASSLFFSKKVLQAIGSAATSLNQVSALFKKGLLKQGTVNVDIGGGKYDKGTEHLATLGVKNLVFDPYNRSEKFNNDIIKELSSGSVDTATVNSVLNVIQEKDARLAVIRQAAKAIKPNGSAYFLIHEGDGDGKSRVTKQKDGVALSWQNHQKASWYLDEVKTFFGDVTRKGNMIVANAPKKDASMDIWTDTDGKPLFSFGGPKANSTGLDKAKQMEQSGALKRDIWKQTGWWKLKDDWKIEIDDSLSSVVKKDGYLSDILDHPVLFRDYPQLSIIKVKFEDMGTTQRGSFDPVTRIIRVNNRLGDIGRRSTISHEVQHILQTEEGFAEGGSPRAMSVEYRNTYKRLHDVEGRPEYHTAKNAVNRFWNGIFTPGAKEYSPEELIRMEQEIFDAHPILKEERKLLKAIYTLNDETGERSYARLTGEVEARLVQYRLDMPPAKRKTIPPWISLKQMLKKEGLLQDGQKVEDVLIDRKGKGVAASEGNMISSKENGSNLGGNMKSEFKAVDINSAEFKRWFAGSAVVDADGKPLVVYHGTGSNFSEFSIDTFGKESATKQEGFFFTDAFLHAGTYSDPALRRKRNKELQQKMDALRPIASALFADKKNKYKEATGRDYANSKEFRDFPHEYNEVSDEVTRLDVESYREIHPSQRIIMEVYLSIKNPLVVDYKGKSPKLWGGSGQDIGKIISMAKREGHDGVLIKNIIDIGSTKGLENPNSSNHYIAFSPTQIKSALSNTGEYSDADSRIMYSQQAAEAYDDDPVIADANDTFRTGAYDDADLIAQIKPGAKVELIREPENEADSDAIRIELNGKKVGYVSRIKAPQLSDLMDDEVALTAKIRTVANAESGKPVFTIEIAKPEGMNDMQARSWEDAKQVEGRHKDGRQFKRIAEKVEVEPGEDFSDDIDAAAKEVLEKSKPEKNWVKKIVKFVSGLKHDKLNHLFSVLTLQQLDDIYSRDFTPVGDFRKAAKGISAMTNELLQEADRLHQKWTSMKPKVAADMADVMFKATTLGFDPDQHADTDIQTLKDNLEEKRAALKAARQANLTGEQKAKTVRKLIKDVGAAKKDLAGAEDLIPAFNALPEIAKEVYREVRDIYQARFNLLQEVLIEQIEKSSTGKGKRSTITALKLEFDKQMKSGPYFPLSRFGDNVVLVKKFDEAGTEIDRMVKTFERFANAEDFAKGMREKGFDVTLRRSKDYKPGQQPPHEFASEVLKIVNSADMDSQERRQIMDEINQAMIKVLPDLSYRKHFAHRKGVKGYSQDAQRAFASHMLHSAKHIAKVKYGTDLNTAIKAMENSKFAHDEKSAAVEGALRNELVKRFEFIMNANVHPAAQILTSLGFAWNIGPSLASAAVNLTQTPLVAYPLMGARFGFRKSAVALTKAARDYTKGDLSWESGMSLEKAKFLNEQERKMFAELIKDGTIDVSQAHDLAAAAATDYLSLAEKGGNLHKYAKVMKLVSAPFHYAEVANRQITALAAYRVAVVEVGHDAAVDIARKIVEEGHFDYGQENRARVMQGNVARVALLFKQYAQNMSYRLVRDFTVALKKSDVTPAEKRQAKLQFAGILGGHFLVAGTMGLPVVGMLGTALNMMASAFGDDDEPWDWKAEFRNWLADRVGLKGGEMIAHGPTRGLLPVDVAGRLSLADLWWRGDDRDLEGRELFNHYMMNIAGPTASNASSVFMGMASIADGDIWKGVEMMVPKFVKDIAKSIRYANEGVTNKQQDVLLGDLEAMELTGQLLGFTPARVAEMYEGKSAVKKIEYGLQNRRTRLKNRYLRAKESGDREAMAEAWEPIQRWNSAHSDVKALRITKRDLARAEKTRQRYRQGTEKGVWLPKTREYLREEGRFANLE